MAIPTAVRKYLLTGLQGTPEVMEALLADVGPGDPRWDNRPDPERFTLREIVAHLADWEGIFLGRVERMLAEDEPVMPDIDEGQIAIDHDYAHADPHASLAQFHAGRERLVSALSALQEPQWQRVGHRPPIIGRLTLDGLAVMILGHDGYHTRQVCEWLK